MGELLHHPALADVPFIIETPGGQSADAATSPPSRRSGTTARPWCPRWLSSRAASAGAKASGAGAVPGTAAVPDSETVAVT